MLTWGLGPTWDFPLLGGRHWLLNVAFHCTQHTPEGQQHAYHIHQHPGSAARKDEPARQMENAGLWYRSGLHTGKDAVRGPQHHPSLLPQVPISAL